MRDRTFISIVMATALVPFLGGPLAHAETDTAAEAKLEKAFYRLQRAAYKVSPVERKADGTVSGFRSAWGARLFHHVDGRTGSKSVELTLPGRNGVTMKRIMEIRRLGTSRLYNTSVITWPNGEQLWIQKHTGVLPKDGSWGTFTAYHTSRKGSYKFQQLDRQGVRAMLKRLGRFRPIATPLTADLQNAMRGRPPLKLGQRVKRYVRLVRARISGK